ncbi:MAG: phenylacetate-CoA ligase [Clostridia bacterium]|nr:phenylacetate-CoA ligase [Clostridiales bacterium]MDK2986346.1 phenylacetate-CoA ligase [Clostridia bacterium]
MIWAKEETFSRDEIKRIQVEKLREVVKRVYENVPFYRKKLLQAGIKPENIQSIEDVRLLPLTTKDDLRDNYPYGLFAVPMDEIVRVHASSGTTGKPTVVGYTAQDIESWTELVARIVTCAGVTKSDVVQIAFGYGMFTGAFGLHYGVERVGATVVPASSGNTEKQLLFMRDFGTTVLVSTPSYALYLAEVAQKMGIMKDLKVRLGLFGGEGCSEEVRKELEKQWGMVATDNYGLSELIGPGVSGECHLKDGLHINEDHFLVEVLDPKTLEPVKEGENGELVVTTLTKEGLPLLRYRTRDIASVTYEKCACGRTTARMSKVSGRTDDMLIIRGVNVFPSQVESVLLDTEGVTPHYQLVVTRRGALDNLEVKIEVTEEFSKSADRKRWKSLKEDIERKLSVILSLKAHVTLAAPSTLERFQGKARRVVDLREAI